MLIMRYNVITETKGIESTKLKLRNQHYLLNNI
jgi:hypothetical protein